MKLDRRSVLVGVGFLACIALASAALAASVYAWQREDVVTRSLAGWLNLPAARVGRVNVSYVDYLAHLGSLRVFLTGPAAAAQGLTSEIGPAQKQSALDRAMRIAAIDDLSASSQLIATSLDVERAYDNLVAQAGTSTETGEIQAFLRDQFGWNEQEFKRYVIRPALLEDALRAKRLRESPDPEAFDKELEERMKKPDVVQYLRF